MPRDLFGAVVRPDVRVGGRTWYSLPLTVLVHALVIAAAVIAPLVATDALPDLPRDATNYIVVAPPAPPPPPRPTNRALSRQAAASQNAAPVVAPTGIARDTGLVVEPEPAAGTGVPGGVPGGIEGAGLPVEAEPPPPAPRTVAPVRITSDLKPPAKIKDVLPVYPDIAMRAHIGGMVILEAVIDAQGRVVNVKVLRSVPLLDQAAIDAVRQWEFTPTRLNGVPVPVVMTVTVNFTLR